MANFVVTTGFSPVAGSCSKINPQTYAQVPPVPIGRPAVRPEISSACGVRVVRRAITPLTSIAIESGGFDGQGGAGLPAKLPPAATKSC
jgi:hypothetical protein